MQIYFYEPRINRRKSVTEELAAGRIAVVQIEDDFFRGELGLPARDGDEVRAFLLSEAPNTLAHIASLRAAGCRNPVLVLRDFRNARSTARALDAGADDDLVMPLKAVELRSRINSIVRRSRGHAADSVRVGEVTAFFDGRDPEVSGVRVALSRREHAIFQQLALNARKVVSKAAIYDAVYGASDAQPFEKVIDVYICKIRKKIDAAAESGHRYIETVHGRGYKFAPSDPKKIALGAARMTSDAEA